VRIGEGSAGSNLKLFEALILPYYLKLWLLAWWTGCEGEVQRTRILD